MVNVIIMLPEAKGNRGGEAADRRRGTAAVFARELTHHAVAAYCAPGQTGDRWLMTMPVVLTTGVSLSGDVFHPIRTREIQFAAASGLITC